jgi:hypothetical protein
MYPSGGRGPSRVGALLVAAGAFFVLLGAVFQGIIGVFVYALTRFSGHGFFVLGFLVAFALFVLALLLWWVPPLRLAWGLLAILFAVLSIPFDAFGGFVLGFLLAASGGAVAMVARGGRPSPRIVLS